jgi:ATP-dependent Clp protease ATP-binding subunit ClpB
VETEHLCKALFEQKDAFAIRILCEAGCDPVQALGFIDRFVNRQPKVSGGAQQVLGRHLETLVDSARDRAAAMGDTFVAVEHLVLAMTSDDRFGRALMSDMYTDSQALLQAVLKLRGGNTVTDQGAESKYESLERYARDLTAEARKVRISQSPR